MVRIGGLLICIIALALSPFSFAAQNVQIKRSDPSGALIDHSSSRLGQQFAKGFIEAWRNYPFLQKYTIVLDERIDSVRGNRITISNDRKVVYQSGLNRRLDNRGAGREAAERVLKTLKAQSRRPKVFDPDLAEDEF